MVRKSGRAIVRRRTANPARDRRPTECRREVCVRSFVVGSLPTLRPQGVVVAHRNGRLSRRRRHDTADSLPGGIRGIRRNARLRAQHRASVATDRSGRRSGSRPENAETAGAVSARLNHVAPGCTVPSPPVHPRRSHRSPAPLADRSASGRPARTAPLVGEGPVFAGAACRLSRVSSRDAVRRRARRTRGGRQGRRCGGLSGMVQGMEREFVTIVAASCIVPFRRTRVR